MLFLLHSYSFYVGKPWEGQLDYHMWSFSKWRWNDIWLFVTIVEL